MIFENPLLQYIHKHEFLSPMIGDIYDYQDMTTLYYLKDLQDLTTAPFNRASILGKRYSDNPFSIYALSGLKPNISASLEMVERQTHRYIKPHFNISEVTSSHGHVYRVEEQIIEQKSFCQLMHFKKILKQPSPEGKTDHFPAILVVAPYSGHYATLLRDTCRTLLKDHDVYVTDWANAREVPITRGIFTLEDYIQYLMDFIYQIPKDVHILAVCQPAVPVLATVALMSQHQDPRVPKSMILMGGPIDTRINPTQVNIISRERPFSWFKENVIARVPSHYPGAFRRVCPGFLMLSGFMSLNLERHFQASQNLYKHLVQGDQESAEAHRQFYDEYRSVLDLPADYFLDSVRVAFQEHCLPLGTYQWRGEKVDLRSIESTAILAVEGEKDDISGVGQTKAALELCPNVPDSLKQYHLQEGVGHYGVFNGRRFRENIVPVITHFIRRQSAGRHLKVVLS